MADKEIMWTKDLNRWIPGLGYPQKGKSVKCDEDRAKSFIAQGLAKKPTKKEAK